MHADPTLTPELTAAERRQWEIARGVRTIRWRWVPVAACAVTSFVAAALVWVFLAMPKPYEAPPPAPGMTYGEAGRVLYSAPAEIRTAHQILFGQEREMAYHTGRMQGEWTGALTVLAAVGLFAAVVLAGSLLRRPRRDPRDTLIRKLQAELDGRTKSLP